MTKASKTSNIQTLVYLIPSMNKLFREFMDFHEPWVSQEVSCSPMHFSKDVILKCWRANAQHYVITRTSDLGRPACTPNPSCTPRGCHWRLLLDDTGLHNMVFLECFSGSEIRTELISTWLSFGSTLIPSEEINALSTLWLLNCCFLPIAGSGTF